MVQRAMFSRTGDIAMVLLCILSPSQSEVRNLRWRFLNNVLIFQPTSWNNDFIGMPDSKNMVAAIRNWFPCDAELKKHLQIRHFMVFSSAFYFNQPYWISGLFWLHQCVVQPISRQVTKAFPFTLGGYKIAGQASGCIVIPDGWGLKVRVVREESTFFVWPSLVPGFQLFLLSINFTFFCYYAENK